MLILQFYIRFQITLQNLREKFRANVTMIREFAQGRKKKEKRKICVLTRFEGTAVPILECTADLKESKTGAVELALKIQ